MNVKTNLNFSTIAIFILSLVYATGCNRDLNEKPSTELERYISELPEIKTNPQNLHIDRDKIVKIHRLESDTSDRIILTEFDQWTIFLLEDDGTVLDKTGGTGRGPGEYLLINSIYYYPESNILQAHDKKQTRLTFYNLRENSLELDHSVSLPAYGNYFLQSVYRGKNAAIGIFELRRDYTKEDERNELHVYKLNEDYTLGERILEMEGAELLEQSIYGEHKSIRENTFGNKKVWNFSNNKLFIADSKDLNFKIFDLDTNKFTEYEFPDVPQNRNTPNTIDFVNEKYGQIFGMVPEYETYLKERDLLPFFNEIYPAGNFLYIPLSNYSKEEGHILQVDLKTSEIKSIRTPPNFFMQGVNQNGIYGLISPGDYTQVEVTMLEF